MELPLEGKIAWTPIHPTKSVWTQIVSHDSAFLADELGVDIKAKIDLDTIACLKHSIEAYSERNLKQC